MSTINFILKDGACRSLDLPDGESVLAGALNAGVRGILGDCGGCCQCATCHVYVEGPGADDIPKPNDTEAAMLELVSAPLLPSSRLCCQIIVNPELEGLIVRIPDTQ